MADSLSLSQISQAFRSAVDEARRFVGATAPNPPVGCTLLDEHGIVLATAAHHRAGDLHAEARALRLCAERGLTARIHTAVVTLEPCNHTGRTPPCAAALLETPVRTVWIGCPDPNPQVAGGGADRLTEEGVDVRFLADAIGQLPDGAILLRECRALTAPFIKRSQTGESWLTVKQALTADGSMIPPAGQTTFTSPASLKLAHQLRRCTDAILTGTGTIRADLPGFTVRHVPDHEERQRRLLVICGHSRDLPASWLHTAEKTFDLLWCRDVSEAPRLLGQHGALWTLLEAGPSLLEAIRNHNLWDDWLQIQQTVTGSPDQIRVMRQHDDTPLDLFPDCAEDRS